MATKKKRSASAQSDSWVVVAAGRTLTGSSGALTSVRGNLHNITTGLWALMLNSVDPAGVSLTTFLSSVRRFGDADAGAGRRRSFRAAEKPVNR